MKLKTKALARSASVLLFIALSNAPRLFAAQNIPRWEQVLNEVLDRAEQERSAEDSVPTMIYAPPDRAATLASPDMMPLRPIIADYVRYFQGPGLKSYRSSIGRLRTYRPMIQRILREEELPPELIWIGLVESGYDPAARSPRNALGIWQLFPQTATTYGLKMDQQDERADPEKSTRAAARYLKFLYARFGDWTLPWPLTMRAKGVFKARLNRLRTGIFGASPHPECCLVKPKRTSPRCWQCSFLVQAGH